MKKMESDYFLEKWAGEFGATYTERCDVDHRLRVPIFAKLVSDLNIFSALECGCNKGHNLEALSGISRSIKAVGIEPQKKLCNQPNIVNGNIYEIPFYDKTFDMVFTSGVLIHIPKEKLELAMDEMYRVSNKYIMMIEYYSEIESGKRYRDFEDKEGVWSRPYGQIFDSQFPSSILIKSGKISDLGNDGWGFTECSYWVFEKK